MVRYTSLEPARAVLVVILLLVSAWYFTWRLGTFNPSAPVFSWIVYGAELYGMLTILLHLVMVWRLTDRTAPSPPAGLQVDVFIPTINEPVDIVRHTVLSAINMEYPHQVWILDDGNRQEMRSLAESLGCRYLSRTGGQDAKAGNLNHALRQSLADFVAVFDADHAPHRKFLMHTLGYFLDARVAFVQTPQDFYNLDSYQHRGGGSRGVIWTEQSLFFRVIQRGKDYWNAAFFCGSCAIMRRSVLDEIGGFVTGTVTEDLHTSLKIHKRGYLSVYHAEPLAFGLAPASVVPFMKQRIRWGQGAMQVWRKEGFLLFARGLTLPQRLNYLASAMTYFDGWQKGILYVAPAIVLLTGVMPMLVLGLEFWLHFIPYYVLVFWVFEEVARGYGQSVFIEQYNMGRFAGFAWATLGLLKSRLAFKVTPKRVTPREATYRFITPQLIIMLVNGAAIPLGVMWYYQRGYLPGEAVAANSVWAAVNLILALAIVSYSLRMSGFKRKDYRFPIPLPARIRLGVEERLCTVDNISSSGCRLYGHFSGQVRQGESVEGRVYLPQVVLPFKGTVTSLVMGEASGQSFIKAVGCRFEWTEASSQDALDLFLYGSDLQWRLNQLREDIRTPLDRWCGYTKPAPQSIPLIYWSAIIWRPQEAPSDQEQFGLLSSSGTVSEMVTFEPLPDEGPLQITVLSPSGHTGIDGRVRGQARRLESPTAPIYAYTLERQAAMPVRPGQ